MLIKNDIHSFSTSKVDYNPYEGFIGERKVSVANYLFSEKDHGSGYGHSKNFVELLMARGVEEHYKRSKRLTSFLKKRDLTFSKYTKSGPKIFTVPCTASIVSIPKSMFNDIEDASKVFVVSLRMVLQSIYGSEKLEDAPFVKYLPEDVKRIFIDAVESSPHYFKQLHHENMATYPFFDNVGLDLVLVEDFFKSVDKFPYILKSGNIDELPTLPFRILELNAGSPSGASNNMNIIEGIYNEDPKSLEMLGKMMPNDHFSTLFDTYKSLGESWTGNKDGVQIILPPGGASGAAPEIHQLAAYSGLIYAESSQLYSDNSGSIRLRTVGENDPIVTAIYSRINSDSALFDLEKDIFLRDAETGEPLYLKDSLLKDKDGENIEVKDENGALIPLESNYSIPNAIDAIVNKKLYLGGLNRILDNKIILAALTYYAPLFYQKELKGMNLNITGPKIIPPESLPPCMESVKEIEREKERWVIKSPNLSGGVGVHILQSMTEGQRNKVISEVKKEPESYAYQELVKIGRIPVSVNKNEEVRFANLAADLRMWTFYGGRDGELPKLTHNALVRYAPKERGPMSSIVNTSKGGGYAPFAIVDDINSSDSVTPEEFAKPKSLVSYKSELPVFVAAQFVQISRIIKTLKQTLKKDYSDAGNVLELFNRLKSQCREVISFLDPRSMEDIYSCIESLKRKVGQKAQKSYYEFLDNSLIKLVELTKKFENVLPEVFFVLLDDLRILDRELVSSFYGIEDRQHDLMILSKIKDSLISFDHNFTPIYNILLQCIEKNYPVFYLGNISKDKVLVSLGSIEDQFKKRIENESFSSEFSSLFDDSMELTSLEFSTLGLNDYSKYEKSIATCWEFSNKKLLTESNYVENVFKEAKASWKVIINESLKLNSKDKNDFLRKSRLDHFKQFPFLVEYQNLINKNGECSSKDFLKLLDVFPYAKYNLESFAKLKGKIVEDLFSEKLGPDKIAFLSKDKDLDGEMKNSAGKCFAKKRKSNGLFSDSDIYVWVAKDMDLATQVYTVGHELIHYYQVEKTINDEKSSLNDSSLKFASFLNNYGNFLGLSLEGAGSSSSDFVQGRLPLHGLMDHIDTEVPFIEKHLSAAKEGSTRWNSLLREHGGLYSCMMTNFPQGQVKALREVLPALENAKNIRFAKDIGLDVNIDEFSSALPIANESQLSRLSSTIEDTIYSSSPNWEGLRLIASNQYFGINFSRKNIISNSLILKPQPQVISLGSSYNQMQQ